MLAVVAVVAVGTAASAGGCEANTQRVGPGEECFVATDCEPGLVCVPLRNGARVCSNDLTEVVGRAPPDGAVPEDGGADPDDGAAPDEDADVPDTGVPVDAGSDTGAPADAGLDAEADAGT